jgi:desampylase
VAALDVLWLTSEQAKRVAQHAADKPTEEICGLLFGSPLVHSNMPPVAQIVRIDNIALDPATRFEMHPEQLVNAQIKAAHQGLDLVGIYHSHPGGQPIPSHTDVAEAHYPDAVYLIVALVKDDARFAAWSIANGKVKSIPFLISDHAPRDALMPIETEFSQPQKVAVVVSAVLAAAFLMIVSLSLLPPAPPLPN